MIDLAKQRVEQLIQRALNDDLPIEEAGEFLSRLNDYTDVKVRDAAHAVVHFLTDHDIRQTDREYDRLQRQILSESLEALQLKGPCSN